MSTPTIRFDNGREVLIHRTLPDGTRDLLFGQPSGLDHDSHAVFDPYGRLKYLREKGIVKADDRR